MRLSLYGRLTRTCCTVGLAPAPSLWPQERSVLTAGHINKKFKKIYAAGKVFLINIYSTIVLEFSRNIQKFLNIILK
jgi:hypothetical protein